MIRQISRTRHLATPLALASLLLVAAVIHRQGTDAQAAPPLSLVLPRPLDVVARARVQRELDWDRIRQDGAGYVQVWNDGAHVELSLDPRLQALVEQALETHPTPYGAAVLLSVADGRVLAMAGRSKAEPGMSARDLVLKPWAPAASVFKLVTAAALVENGVGADEKVCYHDGIHAVDATNLVPAGKRDDSCRTLSFGVAKSQNAIIARLAHDRLRPSVLEEKARKFGFGKALPFDLPALPSQLDVPHDDALEYARTAAGFWHSTLSPLHGAVIAATIARGGTTPPVHLVERMVDKDGVVTELPAAPSDRVISAEVANTVGRMMVGTTEYGTARLGFHDKHSGKKVLPGINVAGKTGSLNRKAPFLAYSWFVGYAPAEKPEVAFAVLLGNDENWRWKAHQVAADLLSGYFHGPHPAPEFPSVGRSGALAAASAKRMTAKP